MTTPCHSQDHGEGDAEHSTAETPEARRGRYVGVWIVLGALFCGAVGHLLGSLLPGGFSYGAAVGLGMGIALGAAVGSRRADANDREIARRAEQRDRHGR